MRVKLLHSVTFSRDREFPRRLQGYGLSKPSAADLDPTPADFVDVEELEPSSEVIDVTPTPEVSQVAPARSLPDGWTAISPRQEGVHRFVESLALIIQLPFCAYLAFNTKLPGWARLLSAAAGIATLVVDGGLLMTYAAKDRGEEGPFSGRHVRRLRR